MTTQFSKKGLTRPLMLLALLSLLTVTAYRWQARGEPRQEEKPPTLNKLEFTGPTEGWPPRPKDRTDRTAVVSKDIPGSLNDELEASIRRAVLENQTVRQLLGSRFAYIGMDEITVDKVERKPADPLLTRVTFFSHTNNQAVEVQARGLKVESAVARKGYQPPEGLDEISQALNLAREDSRLRGKLTGLTETDGILIEPPPGMPGYGHRVVEVFIGQEQQDLPEYHALVDLTDQKVLAAGPLHKR